MLNPNRSGYATLGLVVVLLLAGILMQHAIFRASGGPRLQAAPRAPIHESSASEGAEAPIVSAPQLEEPCQDEVPPVVTVNINAASPSELIQLPGIGPAYAERIVALREMRGGFRYKEELLDVSGIGPARFAQLEHLVHVGPYVGSNE